MCTIDNIDRWMIWAHLPCRRELSRLGNIHGDKKGAISVYPPFLRGQLLADSGPQIGGERDSGERCIYVSHPNGGGLRAKLEDAGFQVNEASYGSIIGEDTDIHHWHRKFWNKWTGFSKPKGRTNCIPKALPIRLWPSKAVFPTMVLQVVGVSLEIPRALI